MEETKKRTRRTRSEMLADKIAKIDEKICELQEKKSVLEAEYEEAKKEEERIAEEESMREISRLLKKKNMSIEDLKELLS